MFYWNRQRGLGLLAVLAAIAAMAGVAAAAPDHDAWWSLRPAHPADRAAIRVTAADPAPVAPRAALLPAAVAGSTQRARLYRSRPVTVPAPATAPGAQTPLPVPGPIQIPVRAGADPGSGPASAPETPASEPTGTPEAPESESGETPEPEPPVKEPETPPVTEPEAPPVTEPETPPVTEAEPPPVTIPDPTPGEEPLVIGIDGGHSPWGPGEISDRVELGAAVTRHEWDPSEPVDSEEAVVLAAASQIHTRIHALLGGNELGDPTHYREWVVEFVRTYGPGGSFWAQHPQLDASRYAIRSIELGNEPYFGAMSATEYADTVRPTLERIRELKLPVTVVLPSYVYGADTSWVDTLYSEIPDLNSLFDAFAFHPYWYGHDPATAGDAGPFDRIDTLRQRMDALGAGAKPIYLTEYGESTASCGSECVGEPVQAEHLQEMIDAAVTRSDWDVKMLIVFQLEDRGTASPDRELQFGLLRQNGTPKPSYPIVRAALLAYHG